MENQGYLPVELKVLHEQWFNSSNIRATPHHDGMNNGNSVKKAME